MLKDSLHLAVYPDFECTEFEVRLAYREQSGATGDLEVCFENIWRAVDMNTFNIEALRIACESLGFTGFEETGLLLSSPVQTTPNFPVGFTCNANDTNLSECDLTGESDTFQNLRLICPGKLIAIIPLN